MIAIILDFNVVQDTLHNIFLQQLVNINLKEDSLPISTHYNVILTSAIANSNVDHSNITFSVKGTVQYKRNVLIFFNLFNGILRLNSDYINAFAKKIAGITSVSVFSQVVYLGNRRIDAEFDQNHHRINEDKVVSLINALEPKLGNSIFYNLCLSFFKY